ncbi:MAG TPA: hypothetical protein VNM38_03260 [Solirubrobacterales bacterium]|nr:hypothetical protein [Solirubrobacterales bacterium]
MSKKLMTGLLALVAFAALALPALASAKPVLKEAGTPVATGTKIVGTNVGNTVMTTSFGSVTCDTSILTGTLTVNSTASGVEGDIETARFFNKEGAQAAGEPEKECSSWTGGVSVTPNPATNGLPWCVEATEANDVVKLRGGSCTAEPRPIRFTLVFTTGLIGTCTYQRSAAAVGSLTTGTGEAEILAQEWTKFEGGGGCPSSGKLDMKFAMETENGTALTFASS